jgi:ABC-type uncharacterized transport system permease subunit
LRDIHHFSWRRLGRVQYYGAEDQAAGYSKSEPQAIMAMAAMVISGAVAAMAAMVVTTGKRRGGDCEREYRDYG